MSFCSEATTHTARKPHRCQWCWDRIEAGEQYRRYFWSDGGDSAGVKMHPECYDDSTRVAREEGGQFEFTPGSYERPGMEVRA